MLDPPEVRARVLAMLALAVLLGPLLYKVGINDIDFKARLATPSAAHLMGTDDLGRDLLARMLYGGRISLAVGLAAMSMALTVGVLIGAIAGILIAFIVAPLGGLYFALRAMVDIGDWLELKTQQWRTERFRKYGW